RMLLVAERGREHQVFEVFRKWGLDAVEIGRVTEDGRLRILENGNVVADIPAHAIAEEGPVYKRSIAPAKSPESSAPVVKFSPADMDLNENFRKLLASPAIASKQWIFEQYDHMVRTNTRVGPGAGDAAIVRIKETKRALALATDGNGRWCQLAPRMGAMHAVAEAARNVACSGARPVAATNCLNFGNPEKPEVMAQFSESIDGIAEACRALDVPITGGNVSFYNETLGRAIYPTPVLGVLGILEDADCALGMAFQHEGDAIILLDGALSRASLDQESQRREFSSSEYAKIIHGVVAGIPPAIDLGAEKSLIDCLVALAAERAIASAHDVSDGGLAVTLAESCFVSSNGFSAGVSLQSTHPAEFALFAETAARAVVSASPASLARVLAIAAQYKVEARQIGKVTRGEFCIQLNGQPRIRAAVDSLRQIWATAFEQALGN
ncbi:MAG: AIR synthase related protein, partial [Candidatus Acidiferrales bacterium]